MADAEPRYYPRCKFHAVAAPIVVHSAEEEKTLSDEWKDAPVPPPVLDEPKAEEEAKPRRGRPPKEVDAAS